MNEKKNEDSQSNMEIEKQNTILVEQTQIFVKQNEISEKQTAVAVRVFWIAVVAVVLAICGIYIAVDANNLAEKANRISNKTLALSITPIVMVDLVPDGNNRYNVEVYNAGQGIAMDVNIDVHLANRLSGWNDGDSGYFYVDWAFKLEHKDRNFLGMISNIGGLDKNYYRNPPTVLRPSSRGWRIGKADSSNILKALMLIVEYKDISGQRYRSIWDGYSWAHSGGSIPIEHPSLCNNSKYKYNYRIPSYVLGDVISVKKQNEEPDKYQNKWFKSEFESGRPSLVYPLFIDWLRDEAQYYEEHGCKNAVEAFKKQLSEKS